MLGDSLRRRRGRPNEKEPKPDEAAPEVPAEAAPKAARKAPRPSATRVDSFSWAYWLLAAVVILLGSFGVGYLLSTQVLFPVPDTAGSGVTVPSLYGEGLAEAEARVREAGLAVGDVAELPSLESEPGEVLAQTPLPGQQLRAGGAVSFAVSAGPPGVRVPPLEGMAPSTARELLESVGFQVDVRQVPSDEAAAGIVTGTEPAAGTTRALPALVTLVVGAGPAAAGDTLIEPAAGAAGSDAARPGGSAPIPPGSPEERPDG